MNITEIKYTNHFARAQKFLTEIQNHLGVIARSQTFNGGNHETNWGDVAEMALQADVLEEIADRLCKRGEFA